MDNKYVLAMYDIRAKQNYIYRTKKLKEIQGASAIIRDCFNDYLFAEAKKYRNTIDGYSEDTEAEAIYNYKDEAGEKEFVFEKFKERMAGNQYVGEVVYDGGGNFIILYESEEVCREISYLFSRRLLVEAPGLNVLCTYIKGLDPQNYNNKDKEHPGDYQKLYMEHRKNENQESTVAAYGTLPIVQAEYISSMPYTEKIRKVQNKKPEKVTAEAYAKYKKFYDEYKHENDEPDEDKVETDGNLNIDEKILDNLVTEKGRESLLAIIYIDGNNMGAKVQSLLKKTDYDSCVNELRKFSGYIEKNCVGKERTDEIDNFLKEKLKNKIIDEIIKDKIDKENEKREKQGEGLLAGEEKKEVKEQIRENINDKEIDNKIKTRRLVVAAGDEITVICNARYAYEIAKKYLEQISKSTKDGEYGEITSCAGISIFHSHTPFADAYRIAEECCESGKKKMKELGIQNACFLDYHYCQGAIGTSLEDIREHEETTDYSLPWLIVKEGDFGGQEELCEKTDIDDLCKELNRLGRSNVKGLAEKAKDGLASIDMEVKRILAHISGSIKDYPMLGIYTEEKRSSETDKQASGSLDNNCEKLSEKKEKYRKLIFDMVNVYDLWFTDESGVSGDE